MVFRIQPVAAVMTVIVAGIGVAVFVYAAGYFGPISGGPPGHDGGARDKGIGRFCATLVAFSAAMLGLVWADSVWTLLYSGNSPRSRRFCWSATSPSFR